jgi:hypothetical protein
MNVNKAKNFVNYLRKIKPNRNWPTPTEYIGGGANGKVFLTNSGKLMKIALGSTPREFRPLHILKNTKFVPKFNQRNWAIVPIITNRSWKNKGTYVNSIKKLFKLNNTTLSKHANAKIANIKGNISKYLKMGYSRKTLENHIKFIKNAVKKNQLQRHKKATVFLMNKINSGKVMTLHAFLTKFKSITIDKHINESTKNRFRRSIFEMIKKIKEKGISHGNLHSGNILVSITPQGKIKIWMIDFGRSTVIPIGMTERNVLSKKKITQMFNSRGLLSRRGENRTVPVFNGGSRANVHMANIHYGIPFTRNMEKNIKRSPK